MKRYNEYKDSGVKWIGEIPSHWKTVRIKHVAKYNPEKTKEIPDIIGYAPMDCIRTGNISAKEIKADKVPTGLTYFEDGDLVVAKVTPCFENSNIAIAANLKNGCAYGSSELFVFRCHAIRDKFLYYYMQDERFKHKGCSTMTGTGGLKRVSSEFIKNAKIPYPSLPEQQAIVSYLDGKVAKIDQYISAAEKKINALDELKQTIISDAVTHGINHDAKMKDSGIKWIGNVPEHWEVKRVAIMFSENKTKNTAYEYDHALKFKYGTLVPKGENGDVSDLKETYEAYTIINKDDIAINCLNLNYDFVSQRVAICPEKGILTSAYLILTPRKGVYPLFFNYLFKAMDSKKLFHGMGTGIRLTLSFNELKRQYLAVPPLSEQQAIVSYIDRKVSEIEQLRNKELSQIEKLKEYKQRLISDVVTGKVKVTND